MSKEWQVGGVVEAGARKGMWATLRHLNFTPCTMGRQEWIFLSKPQFPVMHPLSETTEGAFFHKKET